MAELNRSEFWADDLLSAPLVYAGNVEKAVVITDKLLETTRKIEKSVQAATTISKIAEETKKLGQAQSDLDKAQAQITANSRQRSAQELKSLDELVKKRESLRATIKSLQKDEKEDLRLLKEKIITREEYRKRVDANNVSIARYKVQVTELNRAVKESVLTTRTAGNEYQKLTIALENARKKYKDLAASGTASTQVLKNQQNVVAGLNARVNAIDNAVGQFQRNVGNYTKTFSLLGSTFRQFLGAFGLTSGILLFANVLKNVIKLNIDFEKSMSKVKAITRATDKEYKILRESAILLGEATKFTATQVSELQVEFAKLGFTSREIIGATRATLDLAAATDSDLGNAAQIAGSTIRALGLEAEDTQRIADVLTQSFNSSALSLDSYAESAKYFLPQARLLGISFEELTSYLEVLADANIRGSQAGTALRRILNELSDDGRPVNARLQELAKSGLTLADAEDEVGKYAQAALLILTKSTQQTEKYTEANRQANGVAKETAKIMQDNVAGSLEKLNSQWEGLILSLNQSNGGLKQFIDNITILLALIKRGSDNGIVKVFKDLAYNIGLQLPVIRGVLLLNKALTPVLERERLEMEKAAKAAEELAKAQNQLIKDSASVLLKDYGYNLEEIGKVLADNANKEEILAEVERLHLKDVQAMIDAEGARARALAKSKEESLKYLDSVKRRLELELKYQEEIMNEDTNTLSERLDAARNAEKLKTEITQNEASKRMLQSKGDAKAQKEIALELKDALAKITSDSFKVRREIIKQERFAEIGIEEEAFKKQIETSIKFLQTQVEQEKNIQKQKFVDGLINREQYNKSINEIDKKYSEWNVDGQIFYLESQLLPAIQKYNNDRLALVKGNTEEENKIKLEASEEEKAILNQIAELRQKLLDIQVDETSKSYDKEIAKLEMLKDVYDEFAQSIIGIFNGITARRIQNIDEELKASDAQTEREIELAGDNDKAKEQIEKQGEARRAEIEKRKRAEQRKAAALEKSAAIISAIINTALAVTKTLGQTGFFGIPLATIVGALGGLQVAAIAAQPLPAFEKGGVTDSPVFVAGEKGTEMYVTPQGELGFTPNKATVMEKPVGTEIFSHDKTMKFLAMGGMRTDSVTPDYALYNRIESLENTISKGNKELVKAVIESAPGDSFMQGSLAYEAKKRADGSKKLIRRKTMGY